MSERDEFLATRLAALLNRKSPPRTLAGKPELQAQELASLNRVIRQFAPTMGYEFWWDRFEDVLLRRMKTQAWPIASEVEAACKASHQTSGPDKGETFASSLEETQLVEWFLKFKSQRPGLGSSRHTASLIARGILADEREARFYGFTLSPDQAERAMTQRPRMAEWNHHVAVQARIKGIHEAEADAIERRTISPDQLPAAPETPDAKEFAA